MSHTRCDIVIPPKKCEWFCQLRVCVYVLARRAELTCARVTGRLKAQAGENPVAAAALAVVREEAQAQDQEGREEGWEG